MHIIKGIYIYIYIYIYIHCYDPQVSLLIDLTTY